ncbi:MAG: hypothetical protein ACE5HV_00245 [Acidobacteriota bacterium]
MDDTVQQLGILAILGNLELNAKLRGEARSFRSSVRARDALFRLSPFSEGINSLAGDPSTLLLRSDLTLLDPGAPQALFFFNLVRAYSLRRPACSTNRSPNGPKGSLPRWLRLKDIDGELQQRRANLGAAKELAPLELQRLLLLSSLRRCCRLDWRRLHKLAQADSCGGRGRKDGRHHLPPINCASEGTCAPPAGASN